MLYRALVTPNLNIKENPGWCLSMARQVLGAPAGFINAYVSWQSTKYHHLTRELPNVAVPVWFKWINPSTGERQDHVVVWVPGKGFLSSPGVSYGQKWFDSIVAIENYFRCSFSGWTEDINGVRVAEPLPESKPVPTAPVANTGQGGDYHLTTIVPGFTTASDAAAHTNSNSQVEAGDYKIFNESKGMVNVTRDASQPGWWINPSDNVAPPTPTPAPLPLLVGDTVVPTNLVSYDGVPLTAWDPTYTITELIGDRAVLSARDSVWAAVRTSDIRLA